MFLLSHLISLIRSPEGPVMAATLTGTVSFDKPAYNVGETITATIVHAGSDVTPTDKTFTGTLADAAGETATVTATFVIDEPVAVPTTVQSVTDSDGRTWAQVSDDGKTAVWTATA
jgi:hypothetical protein